MVFVLPFLFILSASLDYRQPDVTISVMSLVLANLSVLSVYREILSRDCLGTLFFSIDRKKS